MEYLEVSPQWRIPLEEIAFEYARSSGPGGQNVNKVSSKATLRWNIERATSFPEGARERLAAQYGSRITTGGDFLIKNQEYRDQERNRQACLERLVEILQSIERPPRKRKASRPSRGSKERRLAGKRLRSQTKEQRRGPGTDG
jgi:ribosome-associated protein